MKFEVIGADGKVKMFTEHKRCIYSPTILKQMAAAGYTFRLDGKLWKPRQPITTGTQKPTPSKAESKKKQ